MTSHRAAQRQQLRTTSCMCPSAVDMTCLWSVRWSHWGIVALKITLKMWAAAGSFVWKLLLCDYWWIWNQGNTGYCLLDDGNRNERALRCPLIHSLSVFSRCLVVVALWDADDRRGFMFTKVVSAPQFLCLGCYGYIYNKAAYWQESVHMIHVTIQG